MEHCLAIETHPLDNTNGPVHDEFTVLGVRNHIGPEDEDATTTHTGRLFLAATPEEPTHDLDGNLTHDGRWVYHWNADNRLYAMETRADLPATLPRQRLEFTYDHAGRRVRKEVLDWNGTEFTPTTDTWFLWHGWQMLAEGEFQSSPLNTENFQLKTSFTWGHDLTGTFEGAGTIGGLLATHNHQLSTNHFPTYDGNGNLVAAIDAATGEPAARFTYSPFGETLTASGPAADQIRFRFSTKYTDPETGLLYYGLRYLNPQTGTWLNRDPIEEEGGVNLYGFVGNDGVNAWDYLGLNVYAVDGTNFNLQRHPTQRSNIFDFHARALSGGETSEYFGGVASRSSRIGPGVVTGRFGPGIGSLIREVKSKVCMDYCANRSVKINMVGWSRGAVVVLEVARLLEENGCCCPNTGNTRPVPVNFLGLYDAVQMVMLRNYANTRPGNISHFHHALRSDPGGIFKQHLTGDPNEREYDNNDGTRSSHGDIGTGGNHLDGTKGNSSRAHAAMVRWARNSGVKIDTTNL